MKKIGFVILFLMVAQIANAQFTITVTITNIQKVKGNMMLMLEDVNAKAIERKVVAVDSKNFSTTFKVNAKGNYAISIYQDVNKNSKLDKNFFGAPSEPYAFSNNVKATFSAPTHKSKLFAVVQNTNINIKLNN